LKSALSEETIVQVQDLRKHYELRRGILSSVSSKESGYISAVDGVSFSIGHEIFGLVGESGSGKTTTGKLLCLLEAPTSGTITFHDVDVSRLRGTGLKDFRRKVQMIFQDPYDSLNPRFKVHKTVEEPLIINRKDLSKDQRNDFVAKILEDVELRPAENFVDAFPHELSGGQRQRVAIARAIVLRPEFIIADEPVSMLDVSLRAGVMNLMLRLHEELDTPYLFITHDLAVARYMVDRIGVMYGGKLVEIGPKEDVIREPNHPYTNILLSSVPVPDPTFNRQRREISVEVSDKPALLRGCRFQLRCPHVLSVCRQVEPELRMVGPEHYSACHYTEQ
jgi:oligopeptide/dipeptide ABC transporter ATP-binding protein